MPKLMFLISFTLLFSINCYSQKFIERYYNENWEAQVNSDFSRFYSISRITDSGWYTKDYLLTLNKIQMIGLYEDKENKIRNGCFYWFYPDGKLKTIGKYVHNLKEGAWLQFDKDGELEDSTNYKNGNYSGISLGWYTGGSAKDSINFNEDGTGLYVSWFDNGQPSAVGRYVNFNLQNGRWKYFHKNGNGSAEELYENGVLKDKQYFDEKGKPAATAMMDADATFPGGGKGWSKFLQTQLYFPSNYEFKNGSVNTIVVSGTINEEGKVIDAEVTVPLHPAFDKIALDAVKNSPIWIPAVSHNRNVYYHFRQLVTFSD